jgi:hypothetical protein
VVGLFVVLLLRPTFIAKKKVNFQANCSALGFAPLRGPSAEWIACGGEVVRGPGEGRALIILSSSILAAAA